MTNNEDIERKMNFIVEQAGEAVTRLANVINTGFTDVNAKINALVEKQIRHEECLTHNEEKHAATEESLRRLSDTVDRYIRERRKGK